MPKDHYCSEGTQAGILEQICLHRVSHVAYGLQWSSVRRTQINLYSFAKAISISFKDLTEGIN